jgi:hypothetical protein
MLCNDSKTIHLLLVRSDVIYSGAQLSLGTGKMVTHPPILKLYFCSPQFYHCTVIQNTAPVCFRTMPAGFRTAHTPQSMQTGCVKAKLLKGWCIGPHTTEHADRLCEGKAAERLVYRTSTGEMNRGSCCLCCTFSMSCKASRAETGYSLPD